MSVIILVVAMVALLTYSPVLPVHVHTMVVNLLAIVSLPLALCGAAGLLLASFAGDRISRQQQRRWGIEVMLCAVTLACTALLLAVTYR